MLQPINPNDAKQANRFNAWKIKYYAARFHLFISVNHRPETIFRLSETSDTHLVGIWASRNIRRARARLLPRGRRSRARCRPRLRLDAAELVALGEPGWAVVEEEVHLVIPEVGGGAEAGEGAGRGEGGVGAAVPVVVGVGSGGWGGLQPRAAGGSPGWLHARGPDPGPPAVGVLLLGISGELCCVILVEEKSLRATAPMVLFCLRTYGPCACARILCSDHFFVMISY
jgi:hypothetical protein